ncbi:MAG: hypothetical protein MJH10_10035 [Epibacterium sp.]|nr:hypothetical protein [Epibacterium sp.]NQX73876.1 hypothetical protein [Epibacterium sp.]
MKAISPGEWSKTDWGGMYLAARSWGISPPDFWDLTLEEWFLEAEMRRPEMPGDFAGKLTQADVDDLWEVARMTDQEWMQYNGAT